MSFLRIREDFFGGFSREDFFPIDPGFSHEDFPVRIFVRIFVSGIFPLIFS
jgi:hypothetical protein